MVIPVILCGGSGTRLWPVSQPHSPKQFVKIHGDRNLFQQTVSRIEKLSKNLPMGDFLIVTNVDLKKHISQGDFQSLPVTIVEPCQRNTAAAICSAAIVAYRKDPEALLLVSPSDHAVKDLDKFLSACSEAVKLADDGYLVTFGLVPTTPETGYGYIKLGGCLSESAFKVSSFKEKPNIELAKEYVKSGDYLWNSGIFVFKASSLIDEFKKYEPELLNFVNASIPEVCSGHEVVLNPEFYERVENISIDYAIMEKTEHAAVVSCRMDWTDLGVWKSVYEFADKDENENVCEGDILTVHTQKSFLKSQARTVAAVGLQNICVIETKDAVLVSSMENTQEVKEIVNMIKKQNQKEDKFVSRPWGGYESLVSGPRFQVKRIVVNPGQKLSLQKHFHRSEHWIVVEGCAEVQIQESIHSLGENQSIYIKAGEIHRLTNPGKIDLVVIEIQVGSYLGEDDIVRLEDAYNRV